MKRYFMLSFAVVVFLGLRYPLRADASRMSRELLLTLIDKIDRGENVIFTKFGDGEYNCIVGEHGVNCDGDNYHRWLAEKLRSSFISLVDKKNVFLGRWWTREIYNFFESLVSKKDALIPWCSFHLIMNDDDFFKYDYLHEFVKCIVSSKRKKIVVGNSNNLALKDFFRANVYVTVPSRNWSYEYNKWFKVIESEMEPNAILLILAGMCSKVLINEITDRHNVSCIDLGSSFDLLASKRKSRPWKHSYEDEVRYYSDFVSHYHR